MCGYESATLTACVIYCTALLPTQHYLTVVLNILHTDKKFKNVCTIVRGVKFSVAVAIRSVNSSVFSSDTACSPYEASFCCVNRQALFRVPIQNYFWNKLNFLNTVPCVWKCHRPAVGPLPQRTTESINMQTNVSALYMLTVG